MAEATTGQLALGAVREQAAKFRTLADGARWGDDPRYVHQMRVATRRLRAAFRVFSDVLPDEASALNTELRWIAEILGAVRDSDVQLAGVRDRQTELCLARELSPFVAWMEARRDRARRTLIDTLDSARYAQLVERLSCAGDSWQPTQELAIEADAPRRIRNAACKLYKRGDRLRLDSPPEERHKVRIRAKRLRYTVEFFVPIYNKPASDLVQKAIDLQDLLGEFQDGVVRRQLIDDAIARVDGVWSGETAFALGRLVQRDVARGLEITGQFDKVYKRVHKAWKRLQGAF